MIFDWTPPDPLNGTAETDSIYLIELQHNINHIQETAGITPTKFTSVAPGASCKFIRIYVEEMKSALENPALLNFYGYSSIRDVLGRNWAAYARSVADKSDCWSYGILNDLRTAFGVLNKGTITTLYTMSPNGKGIASIDSTDLIVVQEANFDFNNLSLVSDGNFFYSHDFAYMTGGKIRKIDKNTYQKTAESSSGYGSSSQITADGSKIFATGGASFFTINELDLNLSLIRQSSDNFYGNATGAVGKMDELNDITCDSSYIYLIGKDFVNRAGPALGSFSRGKVLKIGKSSLEFDSELIYTLNADIRFMSVAIDNTHIYLATDYITSRSGKFIRKYTKSGFSFVSEVEYYPAINFIFWGMVADANNIYAGGIGWGGERFITKYNKSTMAFVRDADITGKAYPVSLTSHNWYRIATT